MTPWPPSQSIAQRPIDHTFIMSEVFRISQSLLYTRDDRTWAPAVFNELIEKSIPRASSQVVLLTGILRALWATTPRTTTSICVAISPTRLRSPPVAHSNEVAEW